jgi:diaminohydroxyphosphoribosylaminopyrimidine deaminase/5-amino-6-(5-phosphoribosylamino)uracil reductase
VLRPHTTDEPVAQADDECGDWAHVPDMFRATATALPPPWCDLFEPLRAGTVDDLVVVGQIGQSLDGRIATENGHSHYINGPEGLAHLHRLRSLVDAVVVGIGTALADDPQLTVRRVAGPHPARVVIDPRGRLPSCARLLTDDGIRRLVVTTEGARSECPSSVELIAFAARGFRRILIEGGAHTVSRFLAANCLDRLHVVVAPLILGSGPAGIALAPVARVEDGMRPPMRAHILGDEVLWDCDLSGQRMAVGRAKTST